MPVKGESEPGFVNIGVPRPLVDEMDRFMAEHPEFGIMGRNEFTRRAIAESLLELRNQVHDRLELESFLAGKPGPFNELRKMRRR